MKEKLMKDYSIMFFENEDYIYITVESENIKPISWEYLQFIKDTKFSHLDFIEVYPVNEEIINKHNVRHLIHVKKLVVPKLKDLENEMRIIWSN